MARLSPYSRLLRQNSAFRRLYVAQLISFGGDWFATVALLGLVLELTNSAAAASLVIVLQTGGFALASPLGGILADRMDRRRLMVAADFLRVPVALALVVVRTPDALWICFLAITLLAVAAAAFEPASSAALPNLVEPDQLGEANVLLGAAWGVMLAVGAGLGGLVAATLGRDAAFAINAASFGLSGLLIVGINRPFQQPRDLLAPAARRGVGGVVESLAIVLASLAAAGFSPRCSCRKPCSASAPASS